MNRSFTSPQGCDEFVVLIEDAALPEAAEAIARKLIATMSDPITVEDSILTVTTSIGIGYTGQPTDAGALMAAADAALYSAKKAGRNTYAMKAMDDVRIADSRTRADDL